MEYINTKAEMLFGNGYFKHEVLPAGYKLGPNKNTPSKYFSDKGFFVSQAYSDYYSQLTGIVSDKYISMDLYYFYIIPCLNRREFVRAYADKNNYSLFFRGVNQPETVVKNRNGIFYDDEERVIDFNTASNLCQSIGEGRRLIIKPTIDTGEGKGVFLVNESDVASDFKRYKKDFMVQCCVAQNNELAKLNPTSLNTLRIMTYRDTNGNVHHLKDKTVLRVGAKGSIRDNAGSGGGICQVFDDGTVNDRVIHNKSLIVESFKNLHGSENFIVPCLAEALSFAERLHCRLPYFDFVGWDIAVDSNNQPVLIEFNLPCEIGFQEAVGPMFVEDLDEIMERISKVRRIKVEHQVNIFDPGFEHLLQTGGEEYLIH